MNHLQEDSLLKAVSVSRQPRARTNTLKHTRSHTYTHTQNAPFTQRTGPLDHAKSVYLPAYLYVCMYIVCMLFVWIAGWLAGWMDEQMNGRVHAFDSYSRGRTRRSLNKPDTILFTARLVIMNFLECKAAC